MGDGRMKVMIAYDGSSYADTAIDHLSSAGLPHGTEVLLTTIVDPSESRPAISEFDLVSAASRRMDAVIAQARQLEARALEDARARATVVTDDLRMRFPEWKIGFDIFQGKPVDALLETAASWESDSIIAGSHGRSPIGRFFLGSVSQSVAEQAGCSVRIVRDGLDKTAGGPVELLIAAANPADAKGIVESIARRRWNVGTRVRIVAVDNGVAPDAVLSVDPCGKSIYENAAEPLTADGLHTSIRIRKGDPKCIWLEEAKESGADVVFVAGNSKNGPGLDAAALGLITDAKCTVEVVRQVR